MPTELDELKQAEAAFFDASARLRTRDGRIPIEGDLRRATRVEPTSPEENLIDPQMTEILEGEFRNRFIEIASRTPGGRVLDICCGPGWLSLELARRGQHVDAYDLSPEAIALAKRMLAENPYRDGFGSVNYNLMDVTTVDLGEDRYDAVTGSSAFHHIHDLPEFMDRIWRALKPGGVVVTIDDMPRGRLELGFDRFFRLILPTYHDSYRRKLGLAARRVFGEAGPEEVFSPMEMGKHDSVYEISRIWYEKFDVIEDVHFNAFSLAPLMRLKAPAAIRYRLARAVVKLDRLLCRSGVCHGFVRVMIGRKPMEPGR
jgi:2-polyprenyl-3-methyl-5-hydroxy-6-metoxy-1,4-benzoquinol methylase